MRSILFVFLSLIPIAIGLDCRKFSFAPACRGIMLKRSEVPDQELTPEIYQMEQTLETLYTLLRHAEAEGIKDCIPISWLRQKLSGSYPNRSL